jgi:outer membrane protein assembly factor BamA
VRQPARLRPHARRDRAGLPTARSELTGTLSASIELNDEQIFSGDSVNDAIQEPCPGSFRTAPRRRRQRINLAWDRRDAPFAATSGTLVTADIEHVNAFPADEDDPDTDPLVSHFMKMSGRFGGYIRFTDSGIALAVSVGVGANVQLTSGSRTYPDRLFYLGGFDYVLVPADLSYRLAEKVDAGELRIEEVAVRGGDFSWNPRVELRLPLTGTFALGVFLDTGNLWVDPLAFNPIKLRYGLGAGLRITTPIGPLAFDYGFNLDPYEWEDVGALHFSIGLF